MIIEPKLKEIIFGTLLGNSKLQTFTGGKTWRICFYQSLIHKEFLFHLFDLFQSYVNTPPKLEIHGKINWKFNTIVLPILTEFAQFFYKNNKKIIPSDDKLLEYLTPIALSYWFMDNGSLKSNVLAYYLFTDPYTLDDLKRIAAIFYIKYNITIRFHKIGKNYRIYIPKSEYHKFRTIIEENIHPSMYYKLPK